MITMGANNSTNAAGSAHLGVSLPSGKGGRTGDAVLALCGFDLFAKRGKRR